MRQFSLIMSMLLVVATAAQTHARPINDPDRVESRRDYSGPRGGAR